MNKDNKDKGRRSLGHSSNSNLTKLESSSSNNIRVVCRFRPPKHGEVIASNDSCQVDLNK